MRLEARTETSRIAIVLAPLAAIGLTLLICALLVAWAGAPVGQTYLLLLEGGFGSRFALTETLTRATPLILTGLAVAVAFRARLFNIGAEGQFYAGALAAVAVGGLHQGVGFGLPDALLYVLMILAAMAAGALLLAVLRVATPLILGTMGVLLCERAGVLNLGIEGIMVAGAFVGWVVVYAGHNLWVGVLAAALVGASFGLLHGWLTVMLALSQHVAGLGITLFATSLSYYSYRVLFPKVSSPPTITPFGDMQGWFGWIPWIGPVLGALTPLTLLALAVVPVLAYLLSRTPAGLAIRAVGENPAAAESAGISVAATRIGAIAAGSALMGVAGAFLTTAAFNAFFFNMINGRGWVCVALVVFGSWRPGKALLGALLFGFFDALQLRLAQSAGDVLPYQFWLMVPFILSILALIAVSRKAAYPQALMKPWRKGER